MTWEVMQTRRFSRTYKKLRANVAADVDAAVATIAADPGIGKKKKGDLAELRAYKFRSQNQRYWLGYTLDEGLRLLYLEAIGPHENFYRDLKC
ncbi:MAG: type II toxin-antitoxin system RelE/ParE family toxin [Methylococcales bacterium]